MENTDMNPFEMIGKKCIHKATKQKGYVCAVGWTPKHVEVAFDGVQMSKTVHINDVLVLL